jgi:hypothetical protein
MTEYTYAFDSFDNICPKSQDDPNPTNDILIKVQMTTNRVAVKAIELATMEIPATQNLIEDEWARLYFSFGIPLPSLLEANRTFTLMTDTAMFHAILPTVNNAIIALNEADPTTPIFTTQVPHLLATVAPFWNFGDAIEVISTADEVTLTNPTTGGLLATVTVISDTEFSVSGFPPATNWKPNPAATTFGSLFYPTIPSFDFMAALLKSLIHSAVRLETGINYSTPIYCIHYDNKSGGFCVQIDPRYRGTLPDCNKEYQGRLPEQFVSSKILVTPGSLANLLGYLPANVPLIKYDFKQCGNDFKCASEAAIFIKSCSQPGEILGLCDIKLTPGMYPTPDSIIQELNFQSNRFYFDPVSAPYTIILSDALLGTAYTITIPTGVYTPISLATTLTDLIQVAWAGSDIQVFYITLPDRTNQFLFTSPSETLFNLDFSTSTAAFKLGYTFTNFRGYSSYKSNVPFEYHDCNSEHFNGCIFNFGLLAATSNRMLISANPPPPLPDDGTTLATRTGANSDELTITSTLAHGFQVGDIATVTVTGVTYTLPVSEVSSGTQVILDIGALDLGGLAPNTSIALAHVMPCKLSLLFAPRCSNNFLFRVLGFPACDVMWTPSFCGTYMGPFVIDTNSRSYVLVQIPEPSGGSARFEHTDVTCHNQTNIIGKVVLLVNPVRALDRYYPMTLFYFSKTILTQLRIRILNPDNSLYQFHGASWSGTLRFYT